MKPICPVALAYKLDILTHEDGTAADELKMFPRRREAMFFLAEMSRRPGGFESLAARVVAACPDAFVTDEMQRIGAPRGGRYSLADCLKVWRALAKEWGPFLGGGGRQPTSNWRSLHAWLEAQIDDSITEAEVMRDKSYAKAAILDGVKTFNWDFLKRMCEEAARERLPRILRNFCEDPDAYFIGGEWFCPDIEGLLNRFMDYHARQVLGSIAQTAAVSLMSEEIETAEATRLPVVMRGESGVGKSTVARTLCEAWPGRRRYFEPRPGLDLRTLIASIASALGIDVERKRSDYDLSDQIRQVLRWSGLLLVCDEADRLVPSSFGKRSAPRRLDWIRCNVVDTRFGFAMLTADDNFNQALARFQKVTGYHDAQWRSRAAVAVALPMLKDMSEEDWDAIARFHFPGASAALVEDMSSDAQVSPLRTRYFQAVGDTARAIAARRGANEPSRADLEAARDRINRRNPKAARLTQPEPIQAIRGGHVAAPAQPNRGGSAGRVITPPESEFPGRVPKPESRPEMALAEA